MSSIAARHTLISVEPDVPISLRVRLKPETITLSFLRSETVPHASRRQPAALNARRSPGIEASATAGPAAKLRPSARSGSEPHQRIIALDGVNPTGKPKRWRLFAALPVCTPSSPAEYFMLWPLSDGIGGRDPSEKSACGLILPGQVIRLETFPEAAPFLHPFRRRHLWLPSGCARAASPSVTTAPRLRSGIAAGTGLPRHGDFTSSRSKAAITRAHGGTGSSSIMRHGCRHSDSQRPV